MVNGSTENCGMRRKIAMAKEGYSRGVILVGNISSTHSANFDDPSFITLVMGVSDGDEFNASREFNAELAVRKSIAENNSI